MADVWPVSLPQTPLYAGNSYSPVNNRHEFGTDAGRVMSRQKYTLRQALIGWNFLLTATQKAAFLTFYQTTLADGALPFEITDPFTGDTTVLARFEEDYSLTMEGPDLFRLAATIRRIS